MTVPTRHETPDMAELRRLLDASGHAHDVYEVNEDYSGYSVETWEGWSIATCAGEQWAQLIAAAVNALPSLLDRLAHMTEARDNARAEVERLGAMVERVRELHASSGDEESQGYLPGGGYGFISPYCTGCEASDEYATAWPCPTIAAIGGGE